VREGVGSPYNTMSPMTKAYTLAVTLVRGENGDAVHFCIYAHAFYFGSYYFILFLALF